MIKDNLHSLNFRIRPGKLLLPLILIAGAGLRLYRWSIYSFWHDEIGWLLICKDNLLNSLNGTITIFKPPLFKLLVFLWAYIGQDEFSLRLLPFIFGILSIIFIYKIGRILFDEKAGLIAAFLLAISPFHIYYSQELSHYTLTAFLALGSVYYLIFCLNENNARAWIKLIILNALCLYTSYISIFLLSPKTYSFSRYSQNMPT